MRQTLAAEAALVYRQITTRSISVWPGTFDLLDSCLDFRLAVASNTQRAYTEAELRMLGLWDYFDCVVFSSDVKACKSDPQVLDGVLDALDVRARTVQVGVAMPIAYSAPS